MESVSNSADASIHPLVERLTIGSAAGKSASLLTNDSRGPGDSATMIFPPRFSYVEPGSYPHILNRENQTQKQLHRQSQQHADGEKLERQVLQQARARQKLLFKLILGKQIFPERPAEPDVLEVNRHQPMEEQRADEIAPADDDQPKNKLEWIHCQES